MHDDGWMSATPELAAALQVLRRPPVGEAGAGLRKRQRLALGLLVSAIAANRSWQRLVPLLDAVQTGALLPPEQFRFAVKSLRAALTGGHDEFAAAIWPAPGSMSGAAAAVLGATCRKLGLKPAAIHYLEHARTALGTGLPAAALLDWCRDRMADRSYEDIAAETARHLAQDPAHTGIAIAHAEALHHLGHTADAIATLVPLQPGAAEDAGAIALQLARLYVRDGRPEDALSALDALAASAPATAARVDRELLRLDALLAAGDLNAASQAVAKLENGTAPGEMIDPVRQERITGRRTRCLMLQAKVEEAMAVLNDTQTGVDLLRKKIAGSIVLGDLDAVNRSEEALTRVLVANWRPGQGSPGYNQHLLFARNTRLNAGFRDICRTLMNMPDAAAIDVLRPYLRDVPFDYSAAIQLAFRMSRRGWLSQPPADDAIAIPKRIVLFWDKPQRPPGIDRLIDTWREFNPGYEVIVFNEASAREFLAAEIDRRHARALGRCQNAAMKADFFRLCYLHVKGGIYADCDDRCRAPLDDWLTGRDAVLYQENHMTFAVANNFIAAAPGRPWLETAIEQALIALEAPVRSFTFYVTGPGLLTMCFAQWLARQDLTALRNVRLLTHAEYAAKVSPHLHVPYKTTAQHWLKQEGAGV